MDFLRSKFDSLYDLIKYPLFYLTRRDAEVAHDSFILFSKILTATKLEKLVLDNKENYVELPFKISSAAGFDKNAQVSPLILKCLGFDRIIVGTITGERWKGNPRPRIKRYPSYDSLINWVGWDNDGAEIISERIKSYKNYEIPTTISIGSTPNPLLSLEEKFKDFEKTINLLKDIPSVDRFEYCPSCPNIDIPRKENQRLLGLSIKFIRNKMNYYQRLDIKVSPDMDKTEIEELINATYDFVEGYVTTNTTTQHSYIKGGGSGEILYPLSLETQKKFHERLKDTGKKIIACGGISSIERIEERRKYGAKEIQILTPLIFNLKLLREIKSCKYMKSF